MSFNNYSGYQTASSGDSASEFSKLSNQTSANIQKISQNVNQLQKMVNQLGTNADSESLRGQLHDVQHYTNQLARETNNQLKELTLISQSQSVSEQKHRKMLRERLMNDFSESLKNFQVIQRTAAQKEKESVLRARANSGINNQGPFDADLNNRAPRSNLIDLQSPTSSSSLTQQQQQQQHALLQIEEECDVSALQEREQSIRKIEGDIVEVNQIFKDLATMIHEQGEMVDSIEANVENAAINVTEGTQQLGKAKEYQSKARRKILFLILLLAVIVLVLVLIIYLSTKN